MKIEGQYQFAAPRQAVWEALLDPAVLARTLPGCDHLECTREGEYQGALNIRVGPVQGKFQGRVVLADLDPPAGYRIQINGRGAPGFVTGDGQLQLEDEESHCTLVYAVNVQVGGKIAGVGQRLLDSSAKVLTQQTLEGLEAQIAARLEPADSGGPVSVEAPSQADFAGRFARGVLADLVPPGRGRAAVLGALILVVMLAIIGIRACGGS